MMNPRQIITLVGLGVLLIVALASAGSMVEIVNADELIVVQSIGGRLSAHVNPGPMCQCLGSVTSYRRRGTYEIDMPVRFNDGGHAEHMVASVQFEMPLDEAAIIKIHRNFGSQEGVETQLIQKVVDKAVYMTGPLMSSTESYASKRNYLINYVEDQIANGVYQTISHDVKVIDAITGTEKTAQQVDIVSINGQIQRQEQSVLKDYGIRTSNFSINQLQYEPNVEAQIQAQQKIAMDVQTSIADARKAEQRRITTEENGKADAAKAKWDQEVVKAKEVTAAEQRREVAKLDAEAAALTKQKDILLGEGEAARKRLVMAADGQLTQKLETYLKVQEFWAKAFAAYPGQLVPTVMMGGTGATQANSIGGIQQFMDILGAKAARDLSLDLSLPRAGNINQQSAAPRGRGAIQAGN